MNVFNWIWFYVLINWLVKTIFYKFQPVLVRMKKMKNEPLDISEYLYCIGQVIADLLCNNAMSFGTFLLVKQYLYWQILFDIWRKKSEKKYDRAILFNRSSQYWIMRNSRSIQNNTSNDFFLILRCFYILY